MHTCISCRDIGPDDLADGLTRHAALLPHQVILDDPTYFIGAYPNCDVQQSSSCLKFGGLVRRRLGDALDRGPDHVIEAA
jgi:hypothetical protein